MKSDPMTLTTSTPTIASKVRRIFATLFDFFLCLIIGIPTALILFMVFEKPIVGGDVGYGDIYMFVIIVLLAPAVSISLICPIYEYFALLGKHSSTLGKRMVGIKVINNQDGPLKKRLILIRCAFKMAYYFLFLAFFGVFFTLGLLGLALSLAILLLFLFVLTGNRSQQGPHNQFVRTSVVLI